ncbi:hypothetical protein BDZ89DRAFT_1162447 [Hymenopellis radicata]|nr:hypothetical protein BDZ89DRAFT_1162447 [Hymenopellis radicata]
MGNYRRQRNYRHANHQARNERYEAACFRPLERAHADTDIPADYVAIYPSHSKKECESLEVPLQRAFFGPRQVLPSDVASIPRSELDPQQLHELMNDYLGTSYALDKARYSLLRASLKYSNDFGVAYSLLRPRWHMRPLDAIDNIRACIATDNTARRNAVRDGYVVNKGISPRRVWDLWSNRVVPTWMVCTELEEYDCTVKQLNKQRRFFAVSHSWVDREELQFVDTPINGYEWPVPIPYATNLECIRTELLHHTSISDSYKGRYGNISLAEDRNLAHLSTERGAQHIQYAWLDVLCLRQEGEDEDEQLRAEEWKLDVPTIGTVYVGANSVVYYFSGLGLPFRIGDLEHHRHWLKRAWTLQEHNGSVTSFLAGITPSSPQLPHPNNRSDTPLDDSVHEFSAKLNRLPQAGSADLFHAIDEMRRRCATSELDKISGLHYLCNIDRVPVYDIGEQPNNAWLLFLEALPAFKRATVFFSFPEPGIGGKNQPVWCPSWEQLMDAPKPRQSEVERSLEVHFDDYRGEFSIECHSVRCQLIGFDADSEDREGRVMLKSETGEWIPFRAQADHEQPIRDGGYTLLFGDYDTDGAYGSNLKDTLRCVIGHIKSGVFKKATVIDVNIGRLYSELGQDTVGESGAWYKVANLNRHVDIVLA